MFNKDNLFSLIKSLSQGEKAFFTKSHPSLKKSVPADYMILFHAIEKMEGYDEEKLKARLKKHNFLKHFPVLKNYLFNLILKQLKDYHKEASVKNELFELLQDANVLIKKALYRESYRVLLKAEKIAEKYEYFTFSMEIFDRLLGLNYDLVNGIETINYSIDIYEKQKLVLSKISEIDELRYLKNLYNAIRATNLSDDLKQKQQLKLLENSVLKAGYPFKSYNAGYYHYDLRGRIYGTCIEPENKELAYQANVKLIEHMESNKDLLGINLINYSSALNGLIYIHHQVRKEEVENSFKIINKLADIKTDSQYLQFRIKEKVIVNKLTYFLFSKKYQEGIAYIEQIEDEFMVDEKMYSPLFFIAALDSFAMTFFLVGQYSKSLKYVNFILSYNNDVRMDILCFNKVLNIMIHYELGNLDHVEYLLKPTKTFLVKNNSFVSFHKEIISFFNDILSEAYNKKDISKKFMELSASLSVIEKTDSEKVLFSLFNFREWADNKAGSFN